MLKCLFNVSKFSKNILLEALDIKYLRETLYKNKLSAFIRLMSNNSTKAIVMHQLSFESYNMFTSDIIRICNQLAINVEKIIIERKIPNIVLDKIERDEVLINIKIRDCISTWYIPDSRNRFKEMLEINIVRKT